MKILRYAEHLDYTKVNWPEGGIYVAANSGAISFIAAFTKETLPEDARAWAKKHMETLKRKENELHSNQQT